MEESYPRLCGGIFLVLLLQARQSGNSASNYIEGGKDTFVESDVLMALAKIVVPHLQKKKSLPSRCSEFKKCEKDFYATVGKVSDKYFSYFSKHIKNQYKLVLTSMEEIVKDYIALDEDSQIDCVKDLLALICQDKSIKDDDIFYVCEHGLPLKRIAISEGKMDVYFPAFLLGIWHYAVVNRPDNTIGQATFKSWHKEKKARMINIAGGYT